MQKPFGGPRWGSSQRSPRPSSWWGGGSRCPLPKNPTPLSALRASGCGPSGLATPIPNYPPTFKYPPTPLHINHSHPILWMCWSTIHLYSEVCIGQEVLSLGHNIRQLSPRLSSPTTRFRYSFRASTAHCYIHYHKPGSLTTN